MAPAIEGWLLKRGHAGQAKRRFFVLLGPVLAYYRGQAPEEKQVPRGQLVLGPESRVIKVPGRRGALASFFRAWAKGGPGMAGSRMSFAVCAPQSTDVLILGILHVD